MSPDTAPVTELPPPGALGEQVDALLAAGRLDEAEQMLREAVTAYPRSIPLLRRSADLHFRRKRYPEALATSAQALAIAPENASLNFQRGLFLIGVQDFSAAEQALEKAVELAPANTRFLLRLADVCLHLDNKERARQCIEKALAIAPDDANVHAHRARMQRMEGNGERAEASLRLAIEKDPTAPAYLLALSDIYRDRRDFARALELADRAVGINPMNPHPYAHRASIYLAAGDFGAAEYGFRKALELQPGISAYEMRLREIGGLRKTREAELAEALEAARAAETNAAGERGAAEEAQPRERKYWKQLFAK